MGIHKKYILNDSPLEINISARQRRRILNYFDEEKQGEGKVDVNLMAMGWEKLSTFYDQCAVEIWKLMKDSFTRLVETHEYAIWERKKLKHRSTSSGLLSAMTQAHVHSNSSRSIPE